jgi:hypothetical protein
LILVELLLMGFWKIPFTCSYRPGKANLTVMGVVYWFAFTVYAYGVAALQRRLLSIGVQWLLFFILTVVALAALVFRRRTANVAGLRIVYEDEPEPEIQLLNLKI